MEKQNRNMWLGPDSAGSEGSQNIRTDQGMLIQLSTRKPAEENRNIFVAHPYDDRMDDFRAALKSVAEEFNVNFIYADQKLTNKHILVKIEGLMRAAAFSLFDITGWNPNVSLELGMAYALDDLDYYVLFDPSHGATDVLSDVRGIDRIEYRTFVELREKLRSLMRDQYGSPEEEATQDTSDLTAKLTEMRARIPEILAQQPGLPMGALASAMHLDVEMTQALVRPLVGNDVETRGVRRGTRYYLMGQVPPEVPEEPDDSAEVEHPDWYKRLLGMEVPETQEEDKRPEDA